jgi:hypothetical protein
MIRLLLFSLLTLLFSAKSFCSGMFYTESFITIRGGTELYVQGDFVSKNTHDAGVRNAGEIHLTGNLINHSAKLFYWSTNGYSDFTADTVVAKLDSILADTTKTSSESPFYRKGSVHFIGKDTQYVIDSGKGIYFSDVFIHNQVVLNSDVHVQGQLDLKKDFNLNGHRLKLFAEEGINLNALGGTGTIAGESDTSQIIGGGEVIAIKGNSDASLSDLKSLGFELYTESNTVSVKLVRRNDTNNVIKNISDGSIRKTFTLKASHYLEIDSIVLHYFDDDFSPATHTNTDFAIWRYNPDIKPAKQLLSTVDTIRKTVKTIVKSDVNFQKDTALVFALASASCPENSPRISLGNDTNVCEGTTVHIENILAGTQQLKYNTWFRDASVIDSTAPTYNAIKSGEYWVHVTSEQGCEKYSDTIHVQFHPNPEPEITVDVRKKCVGEPFLFKYKENNSSILSNTLAIQWRFFDIDTIIPQATYYSDSVYHSYTINGNSAEVTRKVRLEVKSDYGCSRTAETFVTVGNTPLPVINLDSKYINDTTRLFKASNNRDYSAGQTILKTWFVNKDSVSTEDSLIYSFPRFDTYQIGLKMSTDVCEDSTSISATITDLAEVKFRLEKKDFCQKEAIRVVNTTHENRINDGIRYSLYVENDIIKEILSFQDSLLNKPLSLQDTGAYILTLVAELGSWQREYVDTIWVRPNPIINFGGEIRTCRSQLTLQSQDIGTDYLWSNGATTPTLSVTQSGQYGLSMINEHGCISFESVQVVLNTTISSGLPREISHCGEVTVSVNYRGGTYLWSTLDTTRFIHITKTGIYTVTLTDSICTTTDTVFVNILEPPHLNLGRDTGVCSNERLTLSVEPQDSVSYLWNTGYTGHSITVFSAGTYQLTATHQNGCENKESITAIIKNAPVVNLGQTRLLCDNRPVDFNLITESGAATIVWTLPDGAQQHGYLLSSSQAGMHSVFVQYTNGCSAIDSVSIQRGNTGLVADFLLASAIKLGDSVLLANLSPKNLQYQWEISNGFRSNEESPFTQFFREGEFDVRLSVSDGSFCPAIKEKAIYVSSDGRMLPKGERIDEREKPQDSIPENENFIGFLNAVLYPNPNDGNFAVVVKLSTNATLYALLADPLGRVLDQNVFRDRNEYRLEYRFAHLQAGIYFLKLWSGQESRDFKVVVAK